MQEIDRTRRIAELMKREIAEIISRELSDPRLKMINITGVTVSRDYRQSTVYVSSINNKDDGTEIEQVLNNASKYLRRLLSQRINLRITPAITFEYDNTISHGIKMTNLIDSLVKPTDGKE